MLQWPDGRIRPVLFDGSPLLSSAVLLSPDGHLHTGRDAAHLARSHPERLEPNPKRRIDEGRILLGAREVAVRDLVAGVLRRVADEVHIVAGRPREVILTHPVDWGSTRRDLLSEAAERAGLGRPRLVPEPVAAAVYFARRTDHPRASGAPLLIYDLGAGTCDVTLLRAGGGAFEVVGSSGRDDVGGLDVDAAIVDFLRSTHGPLWTDAVTRRQVWDEVCTAKEMLSRTAATIVAVPALRAEVPLNRAEFDELARPVVQPTVSLVASLLDRAGVAASEVDGLYLVGGASRIPLVATSLHQTLGIAPTVAEQPQLVVAEGALHLPEPLEPAEPAKPAGWPVPVAMPAPERAALPPPAPGAGGRLPRRVLVAISIIAALLAGGVIYAFAGTLTERARASAGVRQLIQSTPSGARPDAGPTGPGSAGPSAGGPVRYRFEDFGNLCEKVDVSPLKAIFETQEGTPDATRSGGNPFGSALCIVGLTHKDSTGLGDSIVTVSFQLWVFGDVPAALEAHQTDLRNAAANSNAPVDEPGIGEQAFTRRKQHAGTGPVTDIEYALEVRDSNLRWIGEISANRIAPGGWTRKQVADIEAALLKSARASYAKVVAGR